MPQKMYSFCCRLCLHDGSVHQLFDIYSVKGLDDKLLRIFNIKITTQDSCTTNICLNCFQETLTFERQMQQFQKNKQTVLNNQQRFKKNAPGATSALSTTAPQRTQIVRCNQSEQTQNESEAELPNILTKITQTALNDSTTDGNKELIISSNASTAKVSNKTNKRKNSSASAKDENAISQSSSKVTSSIKKPSEPRPSKSCINGQESSSVVNIQQPAVKRAIVVRTKAKGGNLEKKSVSKVRSSGSTNGPTAVQQTLPTISATANTVESATTKLTTIQTAQMRNLQNNAICVNNIVLKQTSGTNNSNLVNTNKTVLNVNNTVQSNEQNIPIHVINVQQTVTQATNHQQQSLEQVVVENSSMTPKDPKDPVLVELQSCPGIPFSTSGVQSVPLLRANRTDNIVPLKGGLCSIPLANISADILPYESRTVSFTTTTGSNPPGKEQQLAATTNVQNNSTALAQNNSTVPVQHNSTALIPNDSTALEQNNSTAPAQHDSTALAQHNSTELVPNDSTGFVQNNSSALVPNDSTALAQNNSTVLVPNDSTALVQNNSTALATDSQPNDSRDSVISHTTSPSAIKKRRHSTFIRVSSNLFDEPAEKAQFAMLTNNQFVRNIEPPTNVPALSILPHLPVLPQGQRVQIVTNPQPIMPFNTVNVNTMNQRPLFATTAQNNNLQQPIVTNFGINYGNNFLPISVNTTSFVQQPCTSSASAQQSSVALNSNNSNNYSRYMPNSQLSSNMAANGNNASVSSPSTSVQQSRCCFKCNLCCTYYLLESNLTLHLRRTHQMEKSFQTYTIIFDPVIVNKLISRSRRKSIADPLLLSNNRT